MNEYGKIYRQIRYTISREMYVHNIHKHTINVTHPESTYIINSLQSHKVEIEIVKQFDFKRTVKYNFMY